MYSDKEFSHDVHLIFFHGIGDNYKNAQKYAQWLREELWIPTNRAKVKVIVHTHKYPTAFQNYIVYSIASFLLLGAAILAPIFILSTTHITAGSTGLASLTALTCIFLSILLFVVPFIYRGQNLFKSSMEEIEQLIEDGVEPGKIILYGHSFGAAAALEVLKHFAKEDIKLGGIVFTSAFGSFEGAIRSFPVPQTKILNVLPSFFLRKLLKALNLDFNMAEDIHKLKTRGKLDIPVVIINSHCDQLIHRTAQLKHAIENNELLCRSYITIINVTEWTEDPHNDIMEGDELIGALTNIIVNRPCNATISSS